MRHTAGRGSGLGVRVAAAGLLGLAVGALGGVDVPSVLADGEPHERGGGTIRPVPMGGLSIAPDRGGGGRYRHGEHLRFDVDIPFDGFLTVYEVAPGGHVHVIFPHAWDRDPFVRAGRLSLPAPTEGWSYQIDAPRRGTASVVALLSPVRYAPPVWLPAARLAETAPDAAPEAVRATRDRETSGLDARIVCSDGCRTAACSRPGCGWPRAARATTWIHVAPR